MKNFNHILLFTVMAMALWGCGKDENPGRVTPPSPTPDEMNPSDSDKKMYINPLFTQFSVPDPDVIRGDDGYFYMYSTEHADHTQCKNSPYNEII